MYKLSDEAKKVIEEKSQTLVISKSEVLEWMIMEFSPSTKEERKVQRMRQHKAEVEYVRKHTVFPVTHVSIGQAYGNGYLMGWHDFQIRKSTHPFKWKD